MTTTAALPAAVATPTAAGAPGAPRTGGMTDSRDPPGTSGHFDHQLDAARQRHDVPKDAVSTPVAPPPSPSPVGAESLPVAADPHRPAKLPDDTAASALAGAMLALLGPAVTVSAPRVVAAAVNPAGGAGGQEGVGKAVVFPVAPDAGRQVSVREDTPASALAGAMLALLGPAVAAGAPRAVTAAITTATGAVGREGEGKPVAADAKTATLLQPGNPDSPIAAVTAVLAAAVGSFTAAAGAARPRDVSALDSASAMAQAVALSVPGAHAAPLTPHVLQLPAAVGSAAFGHDLGQQVAWLGGQDLKQARIRLHPQELGQLDVSVSVTQGRVDVVFNAQHPAAVLAVQQSLADLGHLLAQHGLHLGHAEVGQHGRSHQRPHGRAASNATALANADEVHVGSLSPVLGAIGLLDTFA